MTELPVVDDHERKRIRESLRRYIRAHDNISVQELLERMVAVLKCPKSSLSLSTLQRFLRGDDKHRTEDRIVHWYYKAFLAKAPDAPGVEKLGMALVTFFSHEAQRSVWHTPDTGLGRQFARAYRVYLRGQRKYLEGTEPIQHPDFPIIEDAWSHAPYEIHYATLEFHAIEDAPFLKVVEHVYNPKRSEVLTAIDAGIRSPRETYEGVATISADENVLIVALRSLDALVQDPRFYLLETRDRKNRAESVLLGSCLTATDKAPGASLCQAFEVKLFPMLDNPA